MAPIAVAFSIACRAACAQTPSEGIEGLEACFALTRAADAVCDHPGNPAADRLDCLEKARTAQLDCIEHVRTALPAAPMPAAAPVVTDPSGASSGHAPPARPAATVLSDPATRTARTEPKIPARAAEAPSTPATDTQWTVSETTSPVDYSAMVTAAMRVPANAPDAPDALVIRCRGLRTDLLVRTDGAWRPSRAGEVEVVHQVDEQPPVRLQWNASADGKTAVYKDDAADLLRSLPEGARLRVVVLDGAGPGHEATFQIAELDRVRKKVAAACKWPPAAEKVPSEKR